MSFGSMKLAIAGSMTDAFLAAVLPARSVSKHAISVRVMIVTAPLHLRRPKCSRCFGAQGCVQRYIS
jgi:formaldehyde-activating enzyme involved in methanogenesis